MTTIAIDSGRLEGRIIQGGPDNSLPGGPPGHVDNTLPPIIPPAPPVVWPLPPRNEVTPPIYIRPPHVGGGPMPGPGRPDNSLPPGSGRPDNSLPPGSGRPDNSLPPGSGRPDNSLPSGGVIDNTLPIPPGIIYPPPGPGADGKYLALVVVAVGSTGQITYAWTVVDPSLTVGWPLPVPPAYVDNTLPPVVPQPKR